MREVHDVVIPGEGCGKRIASRSPSPQRRLAWMIQQIRFILGTLNKAWFLGVAKPVKMLVLNIKTNGRKRSGLNTMVLFLRFRCNPEYYIKFPAADWIGGGSTAGWPQAGKSNRVKFPGIVR